MSPRSLILLAAAAVCAAAGPAAAQTACAGSWGVVRVSSIKPGRMGLFQQAVSDQQAWYKSHGLTTDTFKVGLQQGPTGGFSDTEAVTLHLSAPESSPPRDAGWDAFVKKFRDSSDIVTEKRVCLTDPR